jgi:hypothetical protein
MNLTYKAIVNGKYLCHMNPYHDPKNGHFAPKPGGVSNAHNPSGWVGNKYDGNTKKATSNVTGGSKKSSDDRLSKGFKATSDALGKAAKNVSNIRLHGKKQKTDLSQYSDAELQRIVNRLGNEQRYEQLTRSENVSKGQKFINGLGTGLTIATLVTGAIGGAAGAYTAFTGKSPIELFKKKS